MIANTHLAYVMYTCTCMPVCLSALINVPVHLWMRAEAYMFDILYTTFHVQHCHLVYII
jgi:hypothetical protein